MSVPCMVYIRYRIYSDTYLYKFTNTYDTIQYRHTIHTYIRCNTIEYSSRAAVVRRRVSGYREMLHELLLALVGCTGDVFLDAREQQHSSSSSPPAHDHCTFHLAPDLTFLQHSERYVPPALFWDPESKTKNVHFSSNPPDGESHVWDHHSQHLWL